jgi:hypothetical protein
MVAMAADGDWTIESSTSQVGLEGRFKISANGSVLTGTAAELVSTINSILDGLEDSPQPSDPQGQQLFRQLTNKYIKRLRSIADALNKGNAPEVQLWLSLGEARSNYNTLVGVQLANNVAKVLDEGNLPPWLQIELSRPQELTPDQQELYLDILRARTVVEIVLGRRIARPWYESLFSFFGQSSEPKLSPSARKLFITYLSDLAQIANDGLRNATAVASAQKRLAVFKESFVTREAEVVKGQHVARLGKWAFLFSGCMLLIAYVVYSKRDSLPLISQLLPGSDALNLAINFPLLAGAAAIGTWLSFSLRRVTLGFADLAVVEDDQQSPLARLIFVMLLTCFLGLLVETGILLIGIGVPFSISNSSLVALALGGICGIAERSLSATISKRANEIIGGVTVAPATAQTQ